MKILPKIITVLKISLIAFSLINLSIASENPKGEQPPSALAKMAVTGYYPTSLALNFAKTYYASNVTPENAGSVTVFNTVSLLFPFFNSAVSDHMGAKTGALFTPCLSGARNTLEFISGLMSTAFLALNYLNPNPTLLSVNYTLTIMTNIMSAMGTTMMYKILFPSYLKA